MIDTTNKSCRYITTPDGIAQIDLFLMGDKRKVDRVLVWLGKYDPKARSLRPHIRYRVEECEEVEK